MWRPSLHIDMSPVKRMFPFSVKILVTTIINTINNNVLTFIFGNIFPMKTVGNFTQAMKWDTMAYTTISGTIEQVAQPILVEIADDKDRELRVFRKMIRFTAFLVFPCLFGLSLVAEEFILVTISAKWLDSVPLLQILCVGGAFMPFYTMYQHLVISAGRSDIYMWCNIGQILLQIAIILAFHSFGIVMMVIAYTAFTIAWLGVWHIFAKRLIGIGFLDIAKDIAPFMLASAGVMVVTHYLTTLLSNSIAPYIASPYILLPLRVVIAAALYFCVMKLARVKIMDECISYVKRRNFFQ